MGVRVIKPPTSLIKAEEYVSKIFLGGSIEMGKAAKWQDEFIRLFDGSYASSLAVHPQNTCILNPRRDDWDASWEQKIENGEFYRQVSWELTALERANHILFYLAKDTMSPISLMEIGLFAPNPKPGQQIVVVAEEGFQRKGNVDIVCERYKIKQASTLAEGFFKLVGRESKW